MHSPTQPGLIGGRKVRISACLHVSFEFPFAILNPFAVWSHLEISSGSFMPMGYTAQMRAYVHGYPLSSQSLAVPAQASLGSLSP